MVDTNKTAVRDWWNPEEPHDQAEDDKDVAITARFAERNVTRKLAPRKHHCLSPEDWQKWIRIWWLIESKKTEKLGKKNISRSNLPNKKTQTKSLYRFWAFSASTWGRVEKSREVFFHIHIVMRQPWERQPVKGYVSNGWWKRCKVVH